MSDVIVTSLANLRNEVSYGDGQLLVTDEPVLAGGEDAGPDPYTLLLAALGSCISMTTMLYARRKAWPVESVTIHLRQGRIHGNDCSECIVKHEGFIHRIERRISLEGDLTEEQRRRLQEIARKCPVHKTLTSPVIISDMP